MNTLNATMQQMLVNGMAQNSNYDVYQSGTDQDGFSKALEDATKEAETTTYDPKGKPTTLDQDAKSKLEERIELGEQFVTPETSTQPIILDLTQEVPILADLTETPAESLAKAVATDMGIAQELKAILVEGNESQSMTHGAQGNVNTESSVTNMIMNHIASQEQGSSKVIIPSELASKSLEQEMKQLIQNQETLKTQVQPATEGLSTNNNTLPELQGKGLGTDSLSGQETMGDIEGELYNPTMLVQGEDGGTKIIQIKVAEPFRQVDQSMINQIAESITKSVDAGQQEFIMQLNPERLGKIAVSITIGESGMQIMFDCDNASTKALLSDKLGNIAQMIEQNTNSTVQVHVKEDTTGYYQEDGSANKDNPNKERQQENRRQQEADDFLQQLRIGLDEQLQSI